MYNVFIACREREREIKTKTTTNNRREHFGRERKKKGMYRLTNFNVIFDKRSADLINLQEKINICGSPLRGFVSVIVKAFTFQTGGGREFARSQEKLREKKQKNRKRIVFL